MFEKIVTQVKAHKPLLIKVGAAIAGAVVMGALAMVLVRNEDQILDEDEYLAGQDMEEPEEGDEEVEEIED